MEFYIKNSFYPLAKWFELETRTNIVLKIYHAVSYIMMLSCCYFHGEQIWSC